MDLKKGVTNIYYIVGLGSIVVVAILILYRAGIYVETQASSGNNVAYHVGLQVAFTRLFEGALPNVLAGMWASSLFHFLTSKFLSEDTTRILFEEIVLDYRDNLKNALIELIGSRQLNPLALSVFAKYHLSNNQPLLTQDDLNEVHYILNDDLSS